MTPADAQFAANPIVHRSNARLYEGRELRVRYEVPLVITPLGARDDGNEAIPSWRGILLHEVIDDRFARTVVETGADGLIAVAAGAGAPLADESCAAIARVAAWTARARSPITGSAGRRATR